MKFVTAILLILFSLSTITAQTATAPFADSALAPAAMAPVYISIGKELLLRVALIRRTLDDLSLGPAIKTRANQILDSTDADLKELLAEVQSGHMPEYHRLISVPDTLRAAHARLLVALGPAQSELLQQKLRSLRGEARGQLNWLRQQLIDLNLSKRMQPPCDAILATAQAAVEKLPDMDVEGDQYAAARNTMNNLFARAHDALARVLNEAEQSQLGPRFAELAVKSPATQPASGG